MSGVKIATSHSLMCVYEDADFPLWCERIGIPTGIQIPRAAYDSAVIAWGYLHSSAPRDRYDEAVRAVHAALAKGGVALVFRHQCVMPSIQEKAA